MNSADLSARRPGWVLAAALAFGCAAPPPAVASPPTSPPPQADPPAGPVSGVTVTSSSGRRAEAFLGIPFAAPVSGTNRWTPPRPAARWTTRRAATAFGPIPPQSGADPDLPQDEDCLTINVWRPAGTVAGADRPVMVWIYGGSYVSGGAAFGLYDGAYLAANYGALVVSFNYRVGALGFLRFGPFGGNLGLQDQQAALRWVRRNIAAFGGSPGRVTLFGESAGANSIAAHTFGIPSSAALFRAAILASDPAGGPPKTPREAAVQGRLFAQIAGCRTADCLRDLPVAKVLAAQDRYMARYPAVFAGQELPFAPVVDGRFLRGNPTEGPVPGCPPKPMLLGTLADEAGLFYAGKPLSAADYAKAVRQGFPGQAAPVLGRYPPVADGDNAAVASRQVTDYLFACSTRAIAKKNRAPTYLYRMTHAPSFPVFGGDACRGLVCHGDDLPFLFHTPGAVGGEFTPAEARLSREMMGALSRFASGLAPSPEPDAWPPFGGPRPRVRFFDTPSRTGPFPQPGDCGFWDGVGYDLHPVPMFLPRARRGVHTAALAARWARRRGAAPAR